MLLDFSQITISNIMVQVAMNRKLDEELVRHMVLNSIRMYRGKFKEKYGEIVICCDDQDYWRKGIFPYYKQKRKVDQAKSSVDWNELFRCLNMIKTELKENFPYKVIQVPHAEADDIIGAICNEHGRDLGGDPIVIVSGDKDFQQLQKFSNVDQYSPTQKKFIRQKKPLDYIKEHILRGDKGDGIPNFLSADNCIMEDIKQASIYKDKVARWIKQDPEDFCNEKIMRNYKRNQELIDLDFIPKDIYTQVIEQYDIESKNVRGKLFNYFVKHRLKNLMAEIGQF